MNIKLFREHIIQSDAIRLAWDLSIVYLCYYICRMVFLLENWHIFASEIDWSLFVRLSAGGLKFDTSAIAYTNAIVILMFLLPLHTKEKQSYHAITKAIYVAVNTICLILNMVDSVLFEFRRHRITTETFREFQNENNLLKIFVTEAVNHWYLILIVIALSYILCRLYAGPVKNWASLKRYYFSRILLLLLFGTAAVWGMRGVSLLTVNRPMAISFAHKYVDNPTQTGIVLNTPFAIIRTIGQLPPQAPKFFTDSQQLDSIFSPVHLPDSSAVPNKKNVVILILESFSQEFVGALNKEEGKGYTGYTPFLDSLLSVSTYYKNSFANSSFSIDAPPAILASIPRTGRPFVLTPFSLNKLQSLGTELKKFGYNTSFFLGAENESLGIGAFVRSIGFDNYYGINEYCADSRFGGKDDYDGTWGIWDEPFLQFFCTKISEKRQPFIATLFTITSHHPFNLPKKYKDIFPEEGAYALCKCIRYTDFALKRFFETASKQPWFDNTLFVISADHTNSRRVLGRYKTSVGEYRIPILFYDPSGALPKGQQDGIAQQIDIMPTVLNYLGYDKPYISFGKDLFNTDSNDTWAFNWHEYPQYIKGDYVIRMYDEKVTEIYNYVDDPLLQHNIIDSVPYKDMENEMKAIMQSYLQRMAEDDMSVK